MLFLTRYCLLLFFSVPNHLPACPPLRLLANASSRRPSHPPPVDTNDASGVDEALAALGLSDKDGGGDEKRPEKRMKAAWAAFQERELPELKQEKPGLRINQYKEMLWQRWQLQQRKQPFRQEL